jgi:hypothetical protein
MRAHGSSSLRIDANGDGLFNDRLAGVERNTLRAADQWALSIYVAYIIPFRKRATAITGVRATEFSGSQVSNVGAFSAVLRPADAGAERAAYRSQRRVQFLITSVTNGGTHGDDDQCRDIK